MFYQDTKTAKAAAIGTIMPWTGALSDIPKGWLFCNGQSVEASDYPLLVQAIGDTYNAGVSTLGGNFPNYTGGIVLPQLNGKALMDLEDTYFSNRALGGTGREADINTEARSIISPYIGTNSDNSIPVIFNDVYTDVIFTLNDRTGYSGRIKGNTIIPGSDTKTVYIGPRKLGRNHLKTHRHSGSYSTIVGTPSNRPGDGVVPYDNVQLQFDMNVVDNQPGPQGDTVTFTYQIREKTWADIENRSGFGLGQAGRVVAGVASENPPVNLIPQRVTATPISPTLLQPRLSPGTVVPYGLGGGNITIAEGYRNWYTDLPGVGNFGTLVSNTAMDFLGNDLAPHTHDEFDVTFDTANLKPQSSMNASVNIPVSTTLDNTQNTGALQINFNTSQPGLNCIYIIRAY